jgi:hypothetical protein
MEPACASDSGVGGQYRSDSKRINELGRRRQLHTLQKSKGTSP